MSGDKLSYMIPDVQTCLALITICLRNFTKRVLSTCIYDSQVSKLIRTPDLGRKSGKVLSKRDVMLMSEKIEFVLNAANDVVHLITHMISHREWIQTCGLIWKQM